MLRGFRVCRLSCPHFEPLRNQCAQHHRQACRHRQIDSDAHAKRRQPHPFACAQKFVQRDDGNTDHGAGAEHVPVEALTQHALRQCRNQYRLRCGQWRGRGRDRARCLSRKAIGARQQIKHGWNREGARHHAHDQRPLLRPWRCADQLPGLQVLQIVVGGCGGREHDGKREQRECDQCLWRTAMQRNDDGQDAGVKQHSQNPDAGNRAVGGADETGQIAADGGHQKATEHHKTQCHQAQKPFVARKRCAAHKIQNQRHHHAQADEDPACDRNRSHIAVGRCAAHAARSRDGGDKARRNRACQLDQGPQRCNGNGARPHEAHLGAPDLVGEIGNVGVGGNATGGSQKRHGSAPRDQHAQKQRQPDGKPHQMPRADKRQRKGEIESGHAVAPHTDEALDSGRGDLCCGQDRKREGCGRAVNHGHQAPAGTPVRRRLRIARGRPHLQDLRRGHPFGIGQVRLRHHRPAQRNGENHADDAATGTDEECGPERYARPPADDDKTGEYEDDRGQRARRRRHRLYDIVFQDGCVAEQRQRPHRDHRGRYRCGERQPDFQAQIDIGGGKDQRDRHAQQQAANAQFGDTRLRFFQGNCSWE